MRSGGKDTRSAVPVEEVSVAVGECQVRMTRAGRLEAFVDTEALLGSADAPEPPYWMHLWPGAIALARVVGEAPEVGPGARIVELGCGLALPALRAALRGAAVVASDWKTEPLALARASAALNGRDLLLVAMDWTHLALRARFDVCLGADIAYDASSENFLVSALAGLLRPGGVAWLADSVNTHRMTLPGALEAAGFSVRLSTVRECEDGRPVWVRLIEARHA